jgi:hypothetical protein
MQIFSSPRPRRTIATLTSVISSAVISSMVAGDRVCLAQPAIATEILLPPATEIPEEVLRTEIILEGRSPIDGKPLTAAEYAELQAEIAEANQVEPEVPSDLKNLVGLLKLRKFIKTVLPFFPIK